MRTRARVFSREVPQQRLAAAIASLPTSAQQALLLVAERTDLPLAAGAWHDGAGGCLVANVVASLDGNRDSDVTLDLRLLDLLPELSSRDLNLLIVAWDTAADQDQAVGDAELRSLLRGALRRAGVADPRGAAADRAVPPESETALTAARVARRV